MASGSRRMWQTRPFIQPTSIAGSVLIIQSSGSWQALFWSKSDIDKRIWYPRQPADPAEVDPTLPPWRLFPSAYDQLEIEPVWDMFLPNGIPGDNLVTKGVTIDQEGQWTPAGARKEGQRETVTTSTERLTQGPGDQPGTK